MCRPYALCVDRTRLCVACAQVVELDNLIYQCHELWLVDCASEYGKRLWKPKNHFASHFPSDIRNFGPARGYWFMRFEALNQLFKSFASTGNFANTCHRCANFWCVRMAQEREHFSKSGWGATRIVRGSAPKTFFASASTTPPDTISALLTLASQVTIQWIFCLYHAGSEYQHGESWLSATWEGQTVLAFIPKYGMYSFQDRKYWVLSLYPFERDATYGLPTSSFSTAFKPRKVLLPVPSAKLSDVRPMWPSMRSEKDGWITFRFVPL